MTDILARALKQRSSLSFTAEGTEALLREHLQLRAMDEVSASNAKQALIYWDVDQNQKFRGCSITMPGPYIPDAKQ